MDQDFEQLPFEKSAPRPQAKAMQAPQSQGTADLNSKAVAPRNHATEVESSRAVQEVQAALVIAKRFPRDQIEAEAAIVTSCRRYTFAEKALYSYPRGKDADGKKNMVSGPSIRMAEMLAQSWGNLEYGFREIDRSDPTVALVEAFCWDKERNTRVVREVYIELRMQLKGGQVKQLTDPRDVYEFIANQAQRRVRAVILEVIPADVVETATSQVKRTLANGNTKENIPLIDRVKKLVNLFVELSVSKEKIEARLGHKMEDTSADELVDLIGIFNAIRDGASKREDWFDYARPEEGKAADLGAALETAAKEKK